MGKYDLLLENVKKRFGKYQTYYQVLGIKKDNVTDEQVKNAYDKKCSELKTMLRGCKGKELEEIEEIIRVALDDAYTALKTEASRKHYQDILDEIEGIEK